MFLSRSSLSLLLILFIFHNFIQTDENLFFLWNTSLFSWPLFEKRVAVLFSLFHPVSNMSNILVVAFSLLVPSFWLVPLFLGGCILRCCAFFSDQVAFDTFSFFGKKSVVCCTLTRLTVTQA
jgi:hypothetical protein